MIVWNDTENSEDSMVVTADIQVRKEGSLLKKILTSGSFFLERMPSSNSGSVKLCKDPDLECL
jgi:hypothetical protein